MTNFKSMCLEYNNEIISKSNNILKGKIMRSDFLDRTFFYTSMYGKGNPN